MHLGFDVRKVSKAIIYRSCEYLLQLRDKSPDIDYPDQWSLFGGEIEPDESPWMSLRRELEEEISWKPENGNYLYHWTNPDVSCRVYMFAVPFRDKPQKLVLNEGQDMKWFTLNQLAQLNSVETYALKHIINFDQDNKSHDYMK